MSSAADICNMALAHLGAESQIASISPPDGSAEAGYCARFYPIARRIALEKGAWTFAKKRVLLAPVANPSETWSYAYQKPSDVLRPLRVLNTTTLEAAILTYYDLYPSSLPLAAFAALNEYGTAKFEIEGDVILTDEPDATLLYIRDITDTTKFSGEFESGLAMLLAGYLAGPIIKGAEGMRIGQAWTQNAMNLLSTAAASDANKSAETATFVADSIKVRA